MIVRGYIVLVVDTTDDFSINSFVDTNFSVLWVCQDDPYPYCTKSHTLFVITMGVTPMMRVSNIQTCISLITMETEYISISHFMIQLLPLPRLVEDLGGAFVFNNER